MFTTKKKTSRRTMLSTLLSVFVLAGMLALPAQADSLVGLIVFENGQAEIGVEQINETDKNDCSKAGSGLNFPISQDGQSGELDLLKTKDRCYTFEAGQFVGTSKDGDAKKGDCIALVDNKGTAPLDCSILAHGNVTGFCDTSVASEGWATVQLANGQVIPVKNLRWFGGGSVAVVYGDIGKTNADAKAGDGFLVGLIQIFGKDNDGQNLFAACFETNGATKLEIRGIWKVTDLTQL